MSLVMDHVDASARHADPAVPSRAETLELTILMPCLNEAETIEVCVRKALGYLARANVRGEVLISDNGSLDGSQAMAEALGARVVHAQERGYGAALINGIHEARGRFIVMGDADDSYDFENLDAFLDALRGGADLVMGNRFKGGIAPGAMPVLHRYLGNPVLSFLGRLLFKVPTSDFHCGLRGFSRASMMALQLKTTGMEFASEMVVKSALYQLKIVEVPTTLKKDGRSRPPHLKTWRDGWRHLKFLLTHSPQFLFFYPGMALIAAGLFGSSLLAAGAVRVTPTLELDIHTLAVSCFAVLIGTQLVMFAGLARRYGMVEGWLPPARTFKRTVDSMRLEPMLQAAGVLGLCGAVGIGWAVAQWIGSGFAPITYNLIMRVLIISLTAVAAAIQIAAAGFLAQVFTIRR